MTRKITTSQSNKYDIKFNNNPIPDFISKDPKINKNISKSKNSLENHLKPYKNNNNNSLFQGNNPKKSRFFTEIQEKTQENGEKTRKNDKTTKNNNKSSNNIRISQAKTVDRKTITSKSSRFSKNSKKNTYSESINSMLSIPYLNNNQYSLGIRGKDIFNWDLSSNMNVFNTPSIYTTLPFLLENKGEYGVVSRNLLIDTLK